MDLALLSTTYFGPIQWYQKLYRYPHVMIEQHDSFIKQTYRNRCIIAPAQGPQALTVPITKASPPRGSQEGGLEGVRLSDHGNWRHQHWQAITSAYGDSPFLEYYEDDLRPFFFEHRWELLIDYNEDICTTMCRLLDIHPNISRTSEYQKSGAFDDFRQAIHPKQI